ncbi:MAG: FAD-dependent monooxygenase [Proteobacteria bacterium]|nr:FAD-dependent monooxygenase [Pseudomonadota bacterium]
MTRRAPHLLIAGAGPVGLTAAMAFASKDIRVTVVEARDALADDLRASTFHPPTLDMLAPSGITDRMLAAGLVCPNWQIRMHPSGERAVFDLSVLRGETAYPFRLQCEQSVYCRIVLAVLKRLASATIRFATTLIDVRQTSDAVEARVASQGEEDILLADYLIGADGAHSAVRKAVGVAMSGDVYPETSILATTRFPFHERLEDLSNVSYCWKPDGTFSLLRLPGIWRASLYARDGQSVDDALTDDGLRGLLHDIVPRANIDVLERRPYRIHRRLAAAYRQGRVFLAGDAAHLNSPSGGMGMNGGIHDAFDLADKLIAVLTQGADTRILDRYERARRPIAADEIIQQADRNRSRMQERDPNRRRAMLDELKRTADNRVSLKAYLLRSSMIEGLRKAAATA